MRAVLNKTRATLSAKVLQSTKQQGEMTRASEGVGGREKKRRNKKSKEDIRMKSTEMNNEDEVNKWKSEC